MKTMVGILAVSGLCVILGSGCMAFRQSAGEINPDKARPMDAKYDYHDLRSMTDEIRDQVLALAPFRKQTDEPPILVILGVENRTSVHMDTKSLMDALQTKLIQSGKVMFINAGRRDDLLREQNYQAQHATDETRAAIGKQLGAKYMLTGSMAELTSESGRQVRLSSKEERYYQLTIEVTDLQSGLIVGAPQAMRVREVSKPLIGW